MSDLEVRRAEPGDVEAIVRLVHDAFEKYVERIGAPPAPMLADYAEVLQSSRVWVIDGDGTIDGVLVTEARGDHLLLDVVAVAPGTQGRGHGARLLARAESDARELGFPEIRLHTNQAMTGNQRFYPRHGYVETGRARHEGYDRVFYTKQVAAE